MSKDLLTNFKAAEAFVELGLTEKDQGLRESASGPGSYKENTIEVRSLIKQVVHDNKISTILDLGCGDWNWMSDLISELRENHSISYIGWDANQNLINKLNSNYKNETTEFFKKDITSEQYPEVELIICRDVLFHLKPSLIQRVLNNVKSSSAQWLITTSYNVNINKTENEIRVNNNINDWYFHLINLDVTPYNMRNYEHSRIEENNNKHANSSRYAVLYHLKENKMLDNLFLSVGAMKAGTTWLYEQLKDHPEIHFTPEKEIHYFANKVGIENQLNHRNRILKLKSTLERTAKGNAKFISQNLEDISWYAEYAREKDISNDWYENLFRFNPNKKFCADFSNLYCQMTPDGWENVRKVAKNIKVIYTLRDPLERLWSHYKFHMKWVNREDEALDAGFDHFKELLEKHFFWVNAEYANNYKLLQQSLTGDELMILYFEDFREKPIEMLHEVQQFLGIQIITPEQKKLDKKVNKTKDFGMPNDWREYALRKLEPVYSSLENDGIYIESWRQNANNT